MAELVLGPMLRHADERTATVWVQTDAACTVEVLGARTPTFEVCGHHFALVVVEGLAPGAAHPYEVRLDGRAVWPPPGDAFPAPAIRLAGSGRRRVVFGSCRITRPHEPPHTLRGHEHPHGQGIDALRAFALRAARAGGGVLPDLLLMLGDQIYADQPSPQLKAELARRERPPEAPPDELVDFDEYALAYREAWSEPAVRWLLSTVPTAMVFDDHEIHAEWRISDGWLEEMYAKPWFEQHIRTGLMAYWVFQHVGNLSPAQCAEEGLLDAVRGVPGDAGDLLASRMAGAGRQAGHSHWSYARDLGDARLVVVDSRAGRDVTPGRRELVQEEEWEWVRAQAARPARHLLIASSVPFLLAPGLHHTEAWDEAVADGAWGRAAAPLGERLRRLTVMDHWPSFQRSFRAFAALAADVARGVGGDPPASLLLLSGDVHHCYLAEAELRAAPGPHAPVWQIVCSGFRKELAPQELAVIGLGHLHFAGRLMRRLARAARVPDAGIEWRVTERPEYANQIATLTIDGEHAHVRVEAVVHGEWREPRLHTAFARWLTAPPPGGDPDLPAVSAPAAPRLYQSRRWARRAWTGARGRRRRA